MKIENLQLITIKSSIQLDMLKHQIKSLKLKSRLFEEDFARDMSESRLVLRKGMMKKGTIKPPPQSTSTKVELAARDQKSKKSRPSHSTSRSTKNVPKILSYFQTLTKAKQLRQILDNSLRGSVIIY